MRAESAAVVGQRRQLGMAGLDHPAHDDDVVAASHESFDVAGEPAGRAGDVRNAGAALPRDGIELVDPLAASLNAVAERCNGAFVRQWIAKGALTAVHDVSDGGVAVAIAEMALAGKIGAYIHAPHPLGLAASYFAEDQGLYVATVDDMHLNDFLHASTRAGVPVEPLGKTIASRLIFECAEGDHVVALDELRAAHEGFFPKLMGNTLVA